MADGRVRAKGAGRPAVEDKDPGVWPALEKLVDPVTRGDPMSPLRWTTKSTVKLADELSAQGHRVGPKTVARLLKDCDYSLQANTKTIEGRRSIPTATPSSATSTSGSPCSSPDGQPVISVDTKKKENVGRYANGGAEYQRKGEPEKTNTYDFIGELGKAVPLPGCTTWRRTRGG